MENTLAVSSVLLWVLVLLNLLLTLALVRKVNANVRSADKIESLQAGERAPDFTAQTLQGETVTLATYAGRSVVFIFISTHCAPCREALPRYEDLGPKAARAGVDIVLVSGDEAKETQAFVDEFNARLPVLIAPQSTYSFYKDYKSPGTPSFCMVNERGVIQASGLTNWHWGEWKRLVDAWGQKEVVTNNR